MEHSESFATKGLRIEAWKKNFKIYFYTFKNITLVRQFTTLAKYSRHAVSVLGANK